MQKTGMTTALVLAAALSSVLVAGCMPTADPARQRETNESRTDKGMQSYGAYQPPASDRQVVTDTRHAARGTQTRSAHSLAYELESLPEVKGAAVVVSGRDAYIGVHLAEGGQPLTAEARDLMVRKIRQIDRSIGPVTITTEPAFVQYLSDYADALEKGRPLADFQRRFPELRAAMRR